MRKRQRSNMQTQTQTSQNYFKSLTIIHAALLFGQIIFGIAAGYLVVNGYLDGNKELYDIFQIIVPLGVIGSIWGSSQIMKSRLENIRGKSKLEDKLGYYRSSLIIKFALLEGASLFAIICFLLTADYFLLALAGLTIAIFFINKPTRDKIVTDLDLNYEESMLIRGTKS